MLISKTIARLAGLNATFFSVFKTDVSDMSAMCLKCELFIGAFDSPPSRFESRGAPAPEQVARIGTIREATDAIEWLWLTGEKWLVTSRHVRAGSERLKKCGNRRHGGRAEAGTPPASAGRGRAIAGRVCAFFTRSTGLPGNRRALGRTPGRLRVARRISPLVASRSMVFSDTRKTLAGLDAW